MGIEVENCEKVEFTEGNNLLNMEIESEVKRRKDQNAGNSSYFKSWECEGKRELIDSRKTATIKMLEAY